MNFDSNELESLLELQSPKLSMDNLSMLEPIMPGVTAIDGESADEAGRISLSIVNNQRELDNILNQTLDKRSFLTITKKNRSNSAKAAPRVQETSR